MTDAPYSLTIIVYGLATVDASFSEKVLQCRVNFMVPWNSDIHR